MKMKSFNVSSSLHAKKRESVSVCVCVSWSVSVRERERVENNCFDGLAVVRTTKRLNGKLNGSGKVAQELVQWKELLPLSISSVVPNNGRNPAAELLSKIEDGDC